ncbi:hypothetical protein [Aestuariibaculum sediminum]|uniref:Lipocalin-like domain-containing protein n=1 Tax=Aestuariibaculum sediminum TaxID=2770637 RepID=A0A8J6Q9C3_9FLAO|nr:hypothetical protein [Aestuariibaculum sediminum]MBD0832362.1 hypothetical protein [Aestuariibaculum sediminum]
MKTKLKSLFVLPFFALLLLMSCQDEVVDITTAEESEAIAANSELAVLIEATSTKDGSFDNIIDRASCLTVKLPVKVVLNGLEITVDSEEDYKVIEGIFKEFDYDYSDMEIIFPITIVSADFTVHEIKNKEALALLVKECHEENEEDDDIECIDFKYPVEFSIYNTKFQFVDVVTIENDEMLYKFIHRVREKEVIASLNFPVTLIHADETEVEVYNNIGLQSVIREAKHACDEDDDNDYGDTDFTKERLDEYLKICPWVVHEFERNENDLRELYREYAIAFQDNNVVKVKTRSGDMLTGTWSTRVTDNGALIKLEFDTLVDFTLEWFVYDIEYGRIKLYQAGGNRIILRKNCDVVLEYTLDKIQNYLKECFWRVERLQVDAMDNEVEYIGTPLKFFADNVVKLRVNGELVAGTYKITSVNAGFVLQITLEDRPNLNLQWLITFLEPNLIKLSNSDNKMILRRHCPDLDEDIKAINGFMVDGNWQVALYQDGAVNKTDTYNTYTINFNANGFVKVTDENQNVINGSWLTFRADGLFMGLRFEDTQPFKALNHRWKIKNPTETRIELLDFDAAGNLERKLVLEKKN